MFFFSQVYHLPAPLCSRLRAAGLENDIKRHRPGSWEPLLHTRPHAHTLILLHSPLQVFFSIHPKSLGHLTVPVPPLPCLSHVRAQKYLSWGTGANRPRQITMFSPSAVHSPGRSQEDSHPGRRCQAGRVTRTCITSFPLPSRSVNANPKQ